MLIINIKNSRFLAILLFTAHGGAFAAALAASLNLPLLFLLGAVLALSLWHSLGLHATRWAGRAVLRFQLDGDGDCMLARRNGDTETACRLQSWYADARLVVLQLRCPDRWWSLNLVLAVDAVGADDFHALRARLGLHRLTG